MADWAKVAENCHLRERSWGDLVKQCSLRLLLWCYCAKCRGDQKECSVENVKDKFGVLFGSLCFLSSFSSILLAVQ